MILFKSSKRCLVGVIFIFSAMFSVFSMTHIRQFVSILIISLIGILLLLPKILYMRKTNGQLWSKVERLQRYTL